MRRQHVNLVDEVNLASRARGQITDALEDRLGLLDLGVRRGVDLDDVDRTAAGDLLAEVASPTRFGGRALLTGQRLGQDARRAGLADAAGAREQERVGNGVLRD